MPATTTSSAFSRGVIAATSASTEPETSSATAVVIVASTRPRYPCAVAVTEKKTTLDPLDFLAIDALLDDEERAIRDTVRTFVREQVLPDVGDWFEQGILPRELMAELGKLGLFGMHLDGYGLPGASAVAYGLACLELEAGDSGVRSAVSVQGSLAMFSIWKWGSEEQKQRWLPPMHTGEAIGCFGLTEPDAGSDPGSMRTTAKPRRLRLDPERRQDVDHERDGRRRRHRLGANRGRRDQRLPRREGHARLHGAGDPQEALAARLRHLRARPRRRARPGGEPLPRGRHAARPALLPERGALRDRLGRSRRRPRLLRGGARVREGADRLRQADRRLPADPAEAGRDGARAQPRPPRRAPHRPDEGRRHAPPGARQPREDGQRPRRDRGRPRRRGRSWARTASRSSTR